MKKQLLLVASLMCSFFAAHAQNSCATAVAVTPGTTTVGAINGTYAGNCWSVNSAYAEWYSYTPTETGIATVSSNLSANVAPSYSVDTKLSILTGACTALECYASADDVSASNYLTEISFAVEAGTTYYIEFDSYWSALGFQFELSFAPVSCFPVSNFTFVSLPTTTTATITWDAPAIGTPIGYEVEYGVIDFEQGTGTTVNTEVPQVDFVLEAETDYGFYIRTNCGDGDYSEWTGPITFSSGVNPVSLPYTQEFDDEDNRQDGFNTMDGWVFSSSAANAAYAQSGDAFYFSNTSTTEPESDYLYVRPVTLAMNESVTFSFYTWFLGDANDTATLNLTAGTQNNPESQSLIQSFSFSGGDTDYTQLSATWTAPAPGTYYFAIQNASEPAAGAYSILVDTIELTSILNTDSVAMSRFSVYPNPATNNVNITNPSALISNIQIADINGRAVKTSKFDNVIEAKISIADLASGVYMMTIASDKGTTVRKIIKN